MLFLLSRICSVSTVLTIAVLMLLSVRPTYAQSIDVRFPTPVDGHEIIGAIAARDIGDARLTDHFYTFNGSPGDLLITVQSKNLNGDFDVFTATELRPVLKVTVYAESSTPITKNIYLRKPESLILRVEARSPNDDEGIYHIRFSGSFEPTNNGPLVAESTKPTEESDRQPSRTGDRKTKRVSSVGARIEEPPTEVAAAPTAEPTPSATPEEPTASAKNARVRRGRGRRPPARKTPSQPPVAANKPVEEANKESSVETASAEPAKTETPTSTTTKSLPEEEKTKPETPRTLTKRPAARRSSPRASRAAAPAPAESSPENTARLVIEVKDGTRIEYLMSTVRRVTVENGQIVIVGKQGHIERLPMTDVVRMSIGP